MLIRKLTRRSRLIVAGGATLCVLVGTAVTAPLANAVPLPTVPSGWTFSVAAEGTAPVAPNYFEGFASTINMGGSETAEYAFEGIGSLYTNAGIFGCNQNSDKRTCTTSGSVLPSTDTYDNFDHNVVVQGEAVGSATGAQDLCNNEGAGTAPTEPSPIPNSWPYYTYPAANTNLGADGIPLDLVRASASDADLTNHGDNFTGCPDLSQAAVASDAVVNLDFNPVVPAAVVTSDGLTQPVDPASGVTLDFNNGTVAPTYVSGESTATCVTGGTCPIGQNTWADTAWRVFCAPSNSPLAITTWDQLFQAENLGSGPSPDQPLVLWGPKNNSGTGATWYTYAGCGTGYGRILNPAHLFTENDAQQISQYAAQDLHQAISLNTTSCPANTSVADPSQNGSPLVPCGPFGTTGASSATATVDNCGGTGATTSGLGTSTWTAANEQCVYQEVADSLFFMSYGYLASHPFTASVTIPSVANGNNVNWIYKMPQAATTAPQLSAASYQVKGAISTIAGQQVSGPVLGQPTPVIGAPRANNPSAVLTGRDLWIDYLSDHVRASAAGFVNWFCDAGQNILPKGFDNTTGAPYDTEITQDITAWGFGRLNCDLGSTTAPVTYTPAIASAVIDPGPPNNE